MPSNKLSKRLTTLVNPDRIMQLERTGAQAPYCRLMFSSVAIGGEEYFGTPTGIILEHQLASFRNTNTRKG